MTLIVGTKNNAKIAQIRGALKSLNIDVKGLPEIDFPTVKEDGLTALENARSKAIFYSASIGLPVLSTDNALYFNDLASDKQPGLNVRRIKGRDYRASDEELLAYYSSLIKELGDKVNGYWEFGICLAYPDGKTQEIIIKSPRIFVSHLSPKIIEGYPLDSIQIDPETNKYISEMTLEEQSDFWQKTIGQELCSFIKDYLISK
jgi:inosine/xanthosine triphosphate pyrophosphatase family protein